MPIENGVPWGPCGGRVAHAWNFHRSMYIWESVCQNRAESNDAYRTSRDTIKGGKPAPANIKRCAACERIVSNNVTFSELVWSESSGFNGIVRRPGATSIFKKDVVSRLRVLVGDETGMFARVHTNRLAALLNWVWLGNYQMRSTTLVVLLRDSMKSLDRAEVLGVLNKAGIEVVRLYLQAVSVAVDAVLEKKSKAT